MATGNAKRLIERGVAPPLAIEIARQITAGVGDFRRLMELGMTGLAAKLLATGITTGILRAGALTEAGLVPGIVRELLSQLGGGIPALALLSPITGNPMLSPIDGRILTRAA